MKRKTFYYNSLASFRRYEKDDCIFDDDPAFSRQPTAQFERRTV